eukprot:3004652-Alexandrium_andersonii.AAC.1
MELHDETRGECLSSSVHVLHGKRDAHASSTSREPTDSSRAGSGIQRASITRCWGKNRARSGICRTEGTNYPTDG